MTGFRLDLDWRTSLATALLLPFLLALGLWQLARADEKIAIGAQWEERRQQPPALLEAVGSRDARGLEYLPVKMSGEFLPGKYFLLDNRVYRGKFGYEVLGVFQLDGGTQAVLVNRGWIVGDASRRELPRVPPVEGRLTLAGYVYVSSKAPYLLADTALESGWPKRIQAVEMEKLRPAVEQLAGVSVFPYVVRINAGSSGALTVDWQVVNVSPEKHIGYAVQWFAMAAALMILFILRSSNLWQVLTGSTRTK